MKAKLARQIVKAAESGYVQHPLHLLRKAAFMVGLGLMIRVVTNSLSHLV